MCAKDVRSQESLQLNLRETHRIHTEESSYFLTTLQILEKWFTFVMNHQLSFHSFEHFFYAKTVGMGRDKNKDYTVQGGYGDI